MTESWRKLSMTVSGAANFVTKKASAISSSIGETAFNVADTLGLKGGLEVADKVARKAVKDGGRKLADANKAMSRARRMANRALDFEEEDESLVSSDYELLLSAAGATEKSVGISSSYQQIFAIPAGSAFCWKGRVKKHDISFSVLETREGHPDAFIELPRKYRADEPIQGELSQSHYNRNICLVFDNSHSHLQAKRVVYWVACGANVTLADDSVGAERSFEWAAAEEGPQE